MSAFKIFALKGYFQANVADICKEAGISNGALYKYFANKEALFFSCIDFGIELMAKHVFSMELEGTESFYRKIRHLFEKAVEFTNNYGNVVALYLDLGSVSYNKFAGVVSEKIEERAREFHIQLVREAIDNGEIDPAVDPDIAVYIIDNNLMILAFSIISEHYQKRFQAYFGLQKTEIDDAKKIDIIMKSIRLLLKV